MKDVIAGKSLFYRSMRKPAQPLRPWSEGEQRVRAFAEAALASAKECGSSGQRRVAIKHCLRGLQATAGFTRPFAIRDEIVDFMHKHDPDGAIRKELVTFSLDEKLENMSLWRTIRGK